MYLLARLKLTQFYDNSVFQLVSANTTLLLENSLFWLLLKSVGKHFENNVVIMVHVASLDEDSVFCLACAKMPNVLKIVFCCLLQLWPNLLKTVFC